MCTGAEAALVAAAIGAAGTAASADQSRKQSNTALDQQKIQSRLNAPITQRKRQDQPAPTGGFGSTLLTGSQGVAPGSTSLGGNTLLGR